MPVLKIEMDKKKDNQRGKKAGMGQNVLGQL